MASKLEKLAGVASAPAKARTVKCQACKDFGYLGCPEARTDLGDMIALAFKKATPCTCSEGKWFAEAQEKFNAR